MRHSLRVERDGAVGFIVLLGPGQGNAMGPATWSELPAAFDELEADPAIRAVVICGNGEHFSFGLDVGRMLETYDLASDRGANARRELLTLIERMQRAFNQIQTSRLPVVAAIRGWCIGSGLELACACDLRYAQSGARFSLREVRLAIVADLGGLARLPGIVGEGHARELALTGADIGAERAAQIGLVNAVVPEVIAHAVEIARSIAAHAPATVSGIKHVMNAGQGKPIADSLQYVAAWNAAFLQSEDFARAAAAFRRPGS
ncbi:MAG: crotonase/enoyl-CoA hydratase family protein [Candidatus Velthaea sp.]|jgi:enoyl-CoA hydratase